MAVHAFVTAMLLLMFRMHLLIFNLPLLAYNIIKYREGRFMLEPTDVFRQVPQRKKITFIKLAFYLLSFFIYLFTMASIASSKAN